MKLLFLSRANSIFRLSARNIWRNPRRSLLTLLAVSVGLWSSLTLASIARGVSTQMRANSLQNLTGHLKLFAPGYLQDPVIEHIFPALDLAGLKALPEVQAGASRVRVPGVIRSERDSRGVTLVGINPSEEQGLSFISTAQLRGRMLSGPDDEGIVVGEKMLQELDTELGRRVVLLAENREGKIVERGVRIVGVFDTTLEASERGFLFLGRSVAQHFLGIGSSLSEVSLQLHDIEAAPRVVEALRKEYPSLQVEDWRTLDPLVSSIAQIQQGVLSFWFLLVVSTIALGLMNTMFMAIFERVRELGMLQALGMKPGLLLLTILAESIVLLALGALLGNLLLFLTLSVLNHGIDLKNFTSGLQHVGVGSLIYPVLRRADYTLFSFLILTLGLLSALYPAWRASNAQTTK
jgi:ABC-type lipoprotein release transport system permease subunit